MKYEEIKSENSITLKVEGRIDALASPELQNEILLCLQKMPVLHVDFTNVEYISSAGLRVLFLGHKTATSKGGKMTVHNINSIVSDILKTTGFDKFINIV